MSNITGRPSNGPLALQAGGSFPTSADPNLQTLVGTRWDLSDGRQVMLVGVGATAISTAGLLVQDPAVVANHQNLTVTTYTAYSANGNIPASVIATLGATALNANQYQGGFLNVNSGAGIGQTLRVAGHAAANSGSAATFILEDAPNTALTTASKVSLTPAHGTSVIVNPTTATGAMVGVTLYPLSAGTTAIPGISYGFVTSNGIAACLSDANVAAVGQTIVPSASVAGAVTLSGGTGATVGYASQTAVSAEARMVFLDL